MRKEKRIYIIFVLLETNISIIQNSTKLFHFVTFTKDKDRVTAYVT